MPSTKHQLGGSAGADPPPSATRQFTDREPFFTAFDRALATPTGGQPRVLAFYGVGGIGKTSLLEELALRLTAARPNVMHARIQFQTANTRSPAKALAQVRSQLRDGYGVAFPTFDLAFALYWKAAHPHLPLEKSELRFLSEGELAGDVLSALRDVPIAGVVAKIPRVLGKLRGAYRHWWTRRGSQELRHLAGLDDQGQIAEWLPAFWAADIRAWLADTPNRRLVLFLDTLEALWSGDGGGVRGAPPDDWVRDWAAHLTDTLLVVAGREKLRWVEADATWDGLIEQHLLGGLAPEDAERFLRTAGVAEADVRAAIVERAEGVPFYLDLAVTTYEGIWRAESRPPRADEFDRNLDGLFRRFRHYLSEPLVAALEVLSVPEMFDSERFADLVQAFGTGYPATTSGLRALLQFSFMDEPEPGQFVMHALMRHAFAAQHDPGARARVNARLFEQTRATLTGLGPRDITDQARRALRDGHGYGRHVLDVASYIDWYFEAAEPFPRAAEGRFLLPMHQAVLAHAERALGPEHPAVLIPVGLLGLLLQARGRLAEAEPLFRRALAGCERVLGPSHPDTLDTINNLGSLLHARGRLAEAEPLLRLALAWREAVLGREHSDTITSANQLASLVQDRGGSEEAEALYRRVLVGYERMLGPEHSRTLIAVNNLATLLQALGQLAEAESLLRRALEGQERQLGPEHPDTLAAINNLASVLQDKGQLDEAEPLYCRALAGSERVLGPEHPDTLATINNLALLVWTRGRLAEAEPLLRRALAGCERVLGPEHSTTFMALNTLAGLLRARGQLAETELLLRRARTPPNPETPPSPPGSVAQ